MLILVLGLGPTPGEAAASEDCPDPRTCPTYTLSHENGPRWQPDPDGITRIPFYVNPTSAFLPPEMAVELTLLTTATWEAYLPTVRFEYQGETTTPARADDDLNVIQMAGLTPMATTRRSNDERWIVEFDIMLNLWNTWVPCDPFADNSCTNAPSGTPSYTKTDMQSSLMHELGHALGLGHAPRPSCELTMQGSTSSDDGCTSNNRKWATPGLGDVLGVHALYPFSCESGQSKGEEAHLYRYVCPSIRIFYP